MEVALELLGERPVRDALHLGDAWALAVTFTCAAQQPPARPQAPPSFRAVRASTSSDPAK